MNQDYKSVKRKERKKKYNALLMYTCTCSRYVLGTLAISSIKQTQSYWSQLLLLISKRPQDYDNDIIFGERPIHYSLENDIMI